MRSDRLCDTFSPSFWPLSVQFMKSEEGREREGERKRGRERGRPVFLLLDLVLRLPQFPGSVDPLGLALPQVIRHGQNSIL